MKIKLLRSVLVGDADVAPTRDGTVVDVDHVKGREFVALGLAEAVAEGDANQAPAKSATPVKAARAPRNKMAPAPENKDVGGTDASAEHPAGGSAAAVTDAADTSHADASGDTPDADAPAV